MQPRLFPVTPPGDIEGGQGVASGEGLEYRANRWIVGKLTHLLHLSVFSGEPTYQVELPFN